MKEFSKDEKEFLKSLERCPDDIINYMGNLFSELKQCYEYMIHKEDYCIIKNNFINKENNYSQLASLLERRKSKLFCQKIADRIDERVKKEKKKK